MPRGASPIRLVSLVLLAAAVSPLVVQGEVQSPEELGTQVVIKPEMVTPADGVMFDGMIDEQDTGANPMLSAATTMWEPGAAKALYPINIDIDLGEVRHISSILIWDSNGRDQLRVFKGEPGSWTEMFVEDGVGINRWKFHLNLDAETRYLRVVKEEGGVFGEMLVYEYTPEQKVQALAQRKEAAKQEQLLAKAKEDASNRPLTETGTLFGKLPLVDEIDMGAAAGERTFVESTPGISKVETILGRPARVIPNELEEPGFFAYKLGEGKLLTPNTAYLMTVEFPEDTSRTFTISNRGGDMMRGVQTGQSLGDSMFGYTATNMESLKIPLSGKYEVFQQLFWLNENVAGMELPRGDSAKRTPIQAGGFHVIMSQWEKKQMPLFQGAAVARIRLFEVPNPEKFNVALKFPPAPLPRRHLFYREEMGDGAISSTEPDQRAFAKHEDWYVNHFRNMNFLGMNTFAKDLLEFGAPQHWDVQNSGWYHQSKAPAVWGAILPLATQHGLNVLPYYEYAGSSGKQGLAQRAGETTGPLSGPGDYTHIRWAESKRVDITSPEVLAEFLRVIDLTIVQHKDKANFVGAWIRPRVSQMPISFADGTRARFVEETGHSGEVTREELKENPQLLETYTTWWNRKRQEFLAAVAKHLAEKGVGKDPMVMFQAFVGEPTPAVALEEKRGTALVTDAPEVWEKAFELNPEAYEKIYAATHGELLSQKAYQRALENPVKNWGNWEWTHAAPKADPQNYQDNASVMLTYPFNRLYTVNDPEAMEKFRSKAGLTMIRHYTLNENTMGKKLGYFVTDVDRRGSFGMMAEALAVANGDPWYIGYCSGHIYNRPFPDAVRRFNANFLALPALPSQRLPEASSDEQVVVRGIDAGAQGKYLAVVNTSMDAKTGVSIRLPKGGSATEVATGKVLGSGAATVSLDLEPFELRTILVQ